MDRENVGIIIKLGKWRITLGLLFIIGLSVLLLVVCVGYTGWYFVHIKGFAAAKVQYSMQVHSQLKSNQLLSKALEFNQT